MKIQIGEIYMDKVTDQKITYPNKTRKYLLPCLKHYGQTFVSKLGSVFKVAVGIGDVITDNCGLHHEKHIFILIDSTIATSFFQKFLVWIREQPQYQDDYVFGNIQKSTYHMVVVKFPESFYESFNTFKEGKYSQMYSAEVIKEFFENHPKIKKVFIKDHNYRIHFTERVNRKYHLTGIHRIAPEEWDGELDFPPNKMTEFFNHHLIKHNNG